MPTVTVTGGNASPLGRVSAPLLRAQDTAPVAGVVVQDQPVPTADCRVSADPVPPPARVRAPGTVSVSTNGPTAVSGPLLFTVSVQVPVRPAVKVPAALTSCTSAAAISA